MSKSVLILAATSDLGKPLAAHYAREGYRLLLTARDPSALEVLKNDLAIRYDVAIDVFSFNATKFDEHEAFIQGLPCEIDGVVCLVGYLGDQARAEHEAKEREKILNVNLNGPVSILSLFATQFEKRGSGFIVGVSSVAGERGRSSNCIYGAAKAGFTAFLSGLRQRLRKRNIQVLTAIPGYMRTKMTAHLQMPGFITSSAESAAKALFKTQQQGKSVVYIGPEWRLIMGVIKCIPETFFRNLSF